MMGIFRVLCFAFLLLCVPVRANSSEQLRRNPLSSQLPSIWLTQTKQTPNAIRLKTHQATLAQILQSIASKTGVRIHYSILPAQPITTSCEGENIKVIVECLIGSQVDLAAKLSTKPAKKSGATDNPQLTELWLLPTDNSVDTASTIATHSVATPPTPKWAKISVHDRAQLEATLTDAGAKDAQRRATAVYNLGLVGNKDNPKIKESLRLALRDEDANVRAQAAVAISQRGEQDLLEELTHAELNLPDDANDTPDSETLNNLAALQQAEKLDEDTAVELLGKHIDVLGGNTNE